MLAKLQSLRGHKYNGNMCLEHMHVVAYMYHVTEAVLLVHAARHSEPLVCALFMYVCIFMHVFLAYHTIRLYIKGYC
jgi:hypothetical protein